MTHWSRKLWPVTCVRCGTKSFTHSPKARYCSKECRFKAYEPNRSLNIRMVCKECNRIAYKRDRRHLVYCDKDCANRANGRKRHELAVMKKRSVVLEAQEVKAKGEMH